MLKNVNSLYGFSSSQLYKHMKFNQPEDKFADVLKERLLQSFRDENDFAYMKGYPGWKELME